MIKTDTKKIFLETYGWQTNEYDTALVKAIMSTADYTLVLTEDDADIIMLNTCAIRENAHRKVYGRIHEIRHKRKLLAKTKIPLISGISPLIGILGCMARSHFITAVLLGITPHPNPLPIGEREGKFHPQVRL